jgi:monoamine oxidase
MTDSTSWLSLRPDERLALALDNLETVYAGRIFDETGSPVTVKSLLIETMDAVWAQDNSTGDSFALPAQLTRFFDVARQPEGNVYFAGEHLSFHNTWIAGELTPPPSSRQCV